MSRCSGVQAGNEPRGWRGEPSQARNSFAKNGGRMEDSGHVPAELGPPTRTNKHLAANLGINRK
jgi:hypothetical protein